MSLLKTKELEYMFAKLSNHDIELEDGSLLHIDGKWLGRSATVKEQQMKKSQGGKQAKIMVNVYRSDNRLCMATTEVDHKSGEVDAIDDILGLLDLSGCMVTMDAGYCYQEVVEKLRKEDVDYLIGLRGTSQSCLIWYSGLWMSMKLIAKRERKTKGMEGKKRGCVKYLMSVV